MRFIGPDTVLISKEDFKRILWLLSRKDLIRVCAQSTEHEKILKNLTSNQIISDLFGRMESDK